MHQREAIALVKFLSHNEAELEAASMSAELPTGTALYHAQGILAIDAGHSASS